MTGLYIYGLSMHYPNIFRRCFAIFYDWLLIFSICIAATSVAVFFTHGEAIAANNLFFKLYLFIVISSYYVWFWLHGGQTTGMRAWKIKLTNTCNQPITLQQALMRIFIAIPSYGLLVGFLWQFIDSEKQTLHDKLSKTKLIIINND